MSCLMTRSGKGYKAKFSLYKPWRYTSIWGVEVQLHSFLILTLDGGEWSLHAPAALHPRKGPGTHWMRLGWPQRLSGLFWEETYLFGSGNFWAMWILVFFFKAGTIKHMSDCQLSEKAMVLLLHPHVWSYPRKIGSTWREVSRWHSRRVNFGAKYFYLCYCPSA